MLIRSEKGKALANLMERILDYKFSLFMFRLML